MQIVSLMFTAVIAFLPILIWGYVFSYLDNSPLNARRFAIGILAGGFSVAPVLYLRDILSYAGLEKFDIFTQITGTSSTEIFIAFAVMSITIALITWIASIATFFDSATSNARLFLRSLGVLVMIGVLYVVFHAVAPFLPFFDHTLKNAVKLSGVTFGTLGLVLLYYLIVGVIEESSKHFSMIGSSGPTIESVKKWVLFAIFIALGFGFIENILYIRGTSGGGFAFSTWAFRSIFSLMVHIICSVIVAHAFSRAILTEWIRNSLISYARVLMVGFLLSIWVHAVFDISLTLGFTAIIFVYFFFGYMGLTRVFYKE